MDLQLEARARPVATAADRQMRDRKQFAHTKQLWYLIAVVIGILTLARVIRVIIYRCRSSSPSSHSSESSPESGCATPKSKSIISRLASAIATAFRIVFFRWSIPIGFGCIASISELTFICGYTVAMLGWLFIDSGKLWPLMYQGRSAHIASAQLPFIVALAGKNNVISWLTGIGHEKLNVLHRASARAALILCWIHAITRTISGLPPQFSLRHNWMWAGVVSLTAFTLATILSIRPLRNKASELFLIAHISLVLTFLVCGYFHAERNGFGIYIWPGLVVWLFDRGLRLGRLLFNNRSWSRKPCDDALVESISDDTVRITIRRQMSWKPGQHVYLIVPTISKLPFEAHPFTIASIPTETEDGKKEVVFIVRRQGGFTKLLQEYASRKTGLRVPAYLDGPYGCPPNLHSFTTCIFVAGGSGISYTLPLMLDLIRKGSTAHVQRILFIWIVRNNTHIGWISHTLNEVLSMGNSSVAIVPRVFVTRRDPLVLRFPQKEHKPPSSPSHSGEKLDVTITEQAVGESFHIHEGRPDIKTLLHDEIILSTGPVSVDVAGPSGLAADVRRALATGAAGPRSVLKGTAPVTLHVESFGMATK